MNWTNIAKQSVVTLFFVFPTFIYICVGYAKNSLYEQYLTPYVILLFFFFVFSFLKNTNIRIVLVTAWLFVALQPIYFYYESNYIIKKFPKNFKVQITSNDIYGLDEKFLASYDNFGWRNSGHNLNDLKSFSSDKVIIFLGGSTVEQSYIPDEKTSAGLIQQFLKKNQNDYEIINTGVSGLRGYHNLLLMNYLNNIIPEEKEIIYINLIGLNDWSYSLKALLDNQNRSSNPLIRGGPLNFKSLFHPQYFLLTNIIRSVRNNFMTYQNKTISYDFDQQHKNVFSTYNEKTKITFDNDKYEKMIAWYSEILENIISKCEDRNNTKCIFLDQPVSWHEGNFNDLNYTDTLWMTPSYNEVAMSPESLIRVSNEFNLKLKQKVSQCSSQKCHFIAASKIISSPKNFYDDAHFNNFGANKIYDIIKNYLLSSNLQ